MVNSSCRESLECAFASPAFAGSGERDPNALPRRLHWHSSTLAGIIRSVMYCFLREPTEKGIRGCQTVHRGGYGERGAQRGTAAALPSQHVLAAVDCKGRAGHETRVRAGEEPHQFADFVRAAKSAHGDLRDDLAEDIFGH